MNLYTEEQVKELLKQQRENCNEEASWSDKYEEMSGIIEADEPELPEPVFKWISVKDKLPESGTDVLVYTDEDEVVEEAYYYMEKWERIDYSTIGGVTHWIALEDIPKPPKED